MKTGTGGIILAYNIEVACDSVPDAKIVQIDEHTLEDEVTIPATFMDGPHCIGMTFFQDCILHVNGPQRVGTFDL